jgi:hypothetical protein
MKKNSVAHRRDEGTYKRHLSAFKKVFLDFIYRSPNNTKLSNPIRKVEEVEHSGVVKGTQQEPHKLRGGGHDILTEEFEE